MTQPTYTSGLLFTQAHKAVRERVYTILEAHGLTPSYWAVLGITVRAQDGVRLATVAKEMDVKAPLVTMLAGELITRGLIVRIPHHTDGRAKLLVATPKGRKLAEQVEADLSLAIAGLMFGVTPDEAHSFQQTLETIIANARN